MSRVAFPKTLSQSGQQDYPPAQDPEAKYTSPVPKGISTALSASEDWQSQTRELSFWEYFNSSKWKTEALSPKEANIKERPHQESSPQSPEMPAFLSALS